MKGRGAQLEESPEHRIKVSRKRKPRKGSRRERVEHGESPRGRTNDN